MQIVFRMSSDTNAPYWVYHIESYWVYHLVFCLKFSTGPLFTYSTSWIRNFTSYATNGHLLLFLHYQFSRLVWPLNAIVQVNRSIFLGGWVGYKSYRTWNESKTYINKNCQKTRFLVLWSNIFFFTNIDLLLAKVH